MTAGQQSLAPQPANRTTLKVFVDLLTYLQLLEEFSVSVFEESQAHIVPRSPMCILEFVMVASDVV